MGHTIWVEIEGHANGKMTKDCSIMHKLMDNLDALSVKLQVPKLSDFYDYSELEREYGDLGEEPDEESGEAEDEEPPKKLSLAERQAIGDWFDSASGLKAVQHLARHLVDHFADLAFTPSRSQQHFREGLMGDLAHAEKRLEEAAAKGERFRLLIVP